jgi:hypothetical protein
MNNSFDLNKLNELISSANEALSCNSECQQQKNAQLLKQKYLDSQTNLITAPNQVTVAEKNYITFVKGELAYNDQHQSELSNQAQIIVNKFKDDLNTETSKIRSQIDTYNNLLINYDNVNDLYTNYKKDNEDLFKKLRTKSNEVLTNERKTYYEDQNIDNLKGYYYYILLVLYYVFVVSFGIFSLMYNSQFGFLQKFGVLLFFAVLPYFSTWILGFIIYIIHAIYNIIPKNVYHTSS